MIGRNHNRTFQKIGIHKNVKLLPSKIIMNSNILTHVFISKQLLQINMNC